MAQVSFYKINASQLNSVSIAEGQVIFAQDTGELYIDKDSSTRVKVSGSSLEHWLDGAASGSARTSTAAAEKNGYSLGESAIAEGHETYASGSGAHAEGIGTLAQDGAHAEGGMTLALGTASHAEGVLQNTEVVLITGAANAVTYTTSTNFQESSAIYIINVSNGIVAKITDKTRESEITTLTLDKTLSEETALNNQLCFAFREATFGEYSHSEGFNTSTGQYGEDEGMNSFAAHAEGQYTVAYGAASHAEGSLTAAIGQYSHAEGVHTRADGESRTITLTGDEDTTTYTYDGELPYDEEAYKIIVDRDSYYNNAKVESIDSTNHTITLEHSLNSDAAISHKIFLAFTDGAFGFAAHAEGEQGLAYGDHSHAEGYSCQTFGANSHAEGERAKTIGNASHAEGGETQAIGNGSHAEGAFTKATGEISHAEGRNTQAKGITSHAEGEGTIALGQNSHAEGSYTKAIGSASHAEGIQTISYGGNSHSSGYATIAYGDYSYSHGYGNFSTARITGAANATSYTVNSSICEVGQIIQIDNKYVKITAVNGNTVTVNQSFGDALSNASCTIWLQGVASGSAAFAHGYKVLASGRGAHAEGTNSYAFNDYSYAAGNTVIAKGAQSYAHGDNCIAIGVDSHAEGSGGNTSESRITGAANATTYNLTSTSGLAIGDYIVLRGSYNYCKILSIPNASQVIVNRTLSSSTALSSAACIIIRNLAIGQFSYTFGASCVAQGNYSHAEGYKAWAQGDNSYAIGYQSTAYGNYAYALGKNVLADSGFAEGDSTFASGLGAHAEGSRTVATGSAHAEGQGDAFSMKISGEARATTFTYSDIEEHRTLSVGQKIYCPEGSRSSTITAIDTTNNTITVESVLSLSNLTNSEVRVFSMGYATYTSHVEGNQCIASGDPAHAEGFRTKANTSYTHAEGYYTEANAQYTHVEGYYTKAEKKYQHVEGKYNILDPGSTSDTTVSRYAHIIGNGTSNSNRSNAHTIDWQGNAWFAGDIRIGGTSYDDANTLIAGAASSTNLGGLKVRYDAETQTLYIRNDGQDA